MGFSAQKLMPLIQQTYASISELLDLMTHLSINNILNLKIDENENLNHQNKIDFKKFIELKNINFSYNSEKF